MRPIRHILMASGLIAHCATTILVNFYLAEMQTGDDGSVIVSFVVNKVFGSALMIHCDICAPDYCSEHFGYSTSALAIT